jgi:predicted AAA+ superfamily ATPase
MFARWYSGLLEKKLRQPYVHILFGARQVGKSTLLNSILPADVMRVNLADPGQRARHAARPAELAEMCRALPSDKRGSLVFIDEAQSVPTVFDTVQYLYDLDKERWRFILCGSSARRLRSSGANLLPGRSILHRLFPLTLAEQPAPSADSLSMHPLMPLTWPEGSPSANPFPAWSLEQRLTYGSLPGIVTAAEEIRGDLLKAYASVHLEEEVRREAHVKDWAAFVRFVQLAATESGAMINYASVSQQTGISQPTVKAYYQLLEDMFVGFTVPAFTRSKRKNILSTPRFYFFDLGVRHAAAGLNPSIDTVRADPGPIFEQWVGIELWKRLQYLGDGHLFYQKVRTGAEIDYIIERGTTLIPIEVKWTEHPSLADARHLLSFLDEHDNHAAQGYIICRCPQPLRLHDKILALPWRSL